MTCRILGLLNYIAAIEKLKNVWKSLTMNDIVYLRDSIEELRNIYIEECQIGNSKESSWLHVLPLEIRHKVFQLLDKFSLSQISLAFPNLALSVIEPVYWSNIDICFDSRILSWKEIDFILGYLKSSLKHLTISFNCLCENQFYKELALNRVCKWMKNLTHLDIRFSNLIDAHLIQISNNLNNLTSLSVKTSNSIDEGLKYFLSNSRSLEAFSFDLPAISDKVLSLVYEKHRNTIEKLGYETIISKINDSALYKLKEFPKLEDLTLSNFNHTIPIYEILDDIVNLTNLSLGLIQETRHEFITIFSKQKLKLKKLELVMMNISIGGYLSFEEFCPNVETLVLNKINNVDESIFYLTCSLAKLKNLYAKQLGSAKWDKKFIQPIIHAYDRLKILHVSVFKGPEKYLAEKKAVFNDLLKQKKFLFVLEIGGLFSISNSFYK